jgi:hypothetical protein
VKASVMTVAVNIQGLLHGFASDEVMKHVLGSYALQFEAASYRALVTAAEQAGEREVASTCATILREEEAMAAWLRDHLPRVTEQYLQRAASGADAKRYVGIQEQRLEGTDRAATAGPGAARRPGGWSRRSASDCR